MPTTQSNSRIRRITSPAAPEPPPGTWSNCLLVNGVAYVAGLVARGEDGKVVEGDEYHQAKAIFAKMRGLIEAAGGAMSDVVKLVIFVTDIKNREKVWRARQEVFTGKSRRSPTSAGVWADAPPIGPHSRGAGAISSARRGQREQKRLAPIPPYCAAGGGTLGVRWSDMGSSERRDLPSK